MKTPDAKSTDETPPVDPGETGIPRIIKALTNAGIRQTWAGWTLRALEHERREKEELVEALRSARDALVEVHDSDVADTADIVKHLDAVLAKGGA